jgi:serine/threonine protein kinase
MDETHHLTRCPRCGAALLPHTPEGLCPACLFAIAIGSQSTFAPDTLGLESADAASRNAPQEKTYLTHGQTFGAYRIERLLGCGGMGDVYQAEHIEQGRRVALKVLNRRLSESQDRARFLREGQLAASINHPHSVYIFGSEEIDGTPVIAMELLQGGTLKDRVIERGPLPPTEAVDAILQVIAGLDALQAAGVLHRDIKPANCFVDRDRTVKIGDFGLSISTVAREVSPLTETGTFHGTPQFAAPEQLRSDALDVRADIYAVGATLYYLLTGKPPFDDRNLFALVTRIASDPPRPPSAVVRAIPRRMEAVVLRCLAKNPALRPSSYAELHDALQPFSSTAHTPATIRSRLLAGVIDEMIVAIPLILLNLSRVARSGLLSASPWFNIGAIAMQIAYFGLSEGLWGASIGKRLLRLRVVTAAGSQGPSLMQAFWRALIFHTPMLASVGSRLFVDQTYLLQLMSQAPFLAGVLSLGTRVSIAPLFSTARRRNGLAAVHDLWSATRVVVYRLDERQQPSPRRALDLEMHADAVRYRLGPFDVIGTLGDTEKGALLLGFDPRLRRPVWLHQLPFGTPAVTPVIRDLSRPTRLRWLGGRRTLTDSWDAYEALDGEPLKTQLGETQTWDVVRVWLADFAREIDAGLRDGSLDRLALDCIWIAGDGHAKLLDFRVPGVEPDPTSVSRISLKSAQEFFAGVATRALAGQAHAVSTVASWPRHQLPSSALALLDALGHGTVESSSDVVRRITTLLDRPVRVARRRRAATLALSVTIPTLLVVMGGALSAVALPAARRAVPPQIQDLSLALDIVSAPPSVYQPIHRAAVEVYIAGRFGPMVAEPQFWASPMTVSFLGRRRPLLERIVAEHPHVSPEQLTAAEAAVRQILERQAQIASLGSINPWAIALTAAPFLFMLTALVSIVSAWLFRGGLLLWVFDIAVVTSNGALASRLRTLTRALAGWSWVIVPFWFAPTAACGSTSTMRTVVGAVVVFLAGGLFAVVYPERGLQDRVVGTYLVPR